jgi:hypothetical protein
MVTVQTAWDSSNVMTPGYFRNIANSENLGYPSSGGLLA